MKKEQRIPFINLAEIIDWNLCGFCKYSWSDGSPCSEDSMSECRHWLESLAETANSSGKVSGEDCWGFKPVVNLTLVADIVGAMLSANLNPEKTWWWKGDDCIIVEGVAMKERTK